MGLEGLVSKRRERQVVVLGEGEEPQASSDDPGDRKGRFDDNNP
jgi:hypothetical protein